MAGLRCRLRALLDVGRISPSDVLLKPLLNFIFELNGLVILAILAQLIYVIFNTSFEHALSLPPLYALTAKK